MGHGGSGRGDTDLPVRPSEQTQMFYSHLEEEESSVKVFKSCVDTSTVVIVEQKVDGIELSVFFADYINVRVQEGKGWTEALADQTELGEVAVYRGEGSADLLQLPDGSRHHGDSSDGGLAPPGHQLGGEEVTEVRQTAGAEPAHQTCVRLSD